MVVPALTINDDDIHLLTVDLQTHTESESACTGNKGAFSCRCLFIVTSAPMDASF